MAIKDPGDHLGELGLHLDRDLVILTPSVTISGSFLSRALLSRKPRFGHRLVYVGCWFTIPKAFLGRKLCLWSFPPLTTAQTHTLGP